MRDILKDSGLKLLPFVALMAGSALGAWSPAPNSPYSLPAGAGAQLLANGDFNRDSYADIITANTNLGTLTVFFGDGTGLFGGARNFSCGATPVEVLTADIDRDGRLDIVVGNFIDSGTLTILYGDGSGGVASTRAYPAGTKPLGIVCADFNGDGRPDLAFTNPTQVQVWLGEGSGNFSSAPGSPFPTRGLYPEFLCSADLNGDGELDLAVTNFNSGNVSIFNGDGSGRFNEIGGSPFASGHGTTQIKPADFDRDGRLDLAIANQNDNTVTILLNHGGGNFSTSGTGSPLAVGQKPVELLAADFDGDGKADIAASSLDTGALAMLDGNGDGTFRAAAITNSGQKCPGVTAGQFNGGGLPDLAVADMRGDQVFVLLNDADQQGPGSFRFGSGGYSAGENGGYVEFTLLRVGGNTAAASIFLQSRDGSAQAPADYAASGQRLDFQPGDISKSLRVPLARDNWYEGDETFSLALSSPGGGAGLATPSNATVTIRDAQPPPTVGFDASGYSLPESNGSMLFHVRMSNPAQNPVAIDLEARDISANSGSDYQFPPRTLLFNPGETDATATLQVFTDGIHEGGERLQLRLSGATNGAIAGPAADVEIVDAEPPGVIAFSAPQYRVSEKQPVLSVDLTLSIPAQGDTYVDFTPVDHEARNGFDYSSLAQRVHFAPLEIRQTIEIPIQQDDVYEGNETFSLQLANASGGGVLGASTESLATIIDAQEPGSFSFKVARVDTLANPGAVNIIVALSQRSENPMAVGFTTEDGSARAGLDYRSQAGALVFPGGTTEQALSLEILERHDRSGDEQFAIQLSDPTLGARLGPIDRETVALVTPATLPENISTAITVGEPFVFDLPARGTAPLDITAEPLPPGLALSGGTITGIPTDVGLFTVQVSAKNPWGAAASTLSLVVLPRPNPTPSLTTLDSDGDGCPDEVETSLGSNPGSAGSLPDGRAAPLRADAILAARLSIRLSAKPGGDRLSLNATLPAGGDALAPVSVDVGGVVRTLERGQGLSRTKGRKSSTVLRLRSRRRPGPGASSRVSLKVSRGDLAALLRDEGLRDGDAKKSSADVPVLILWGEQCFRLTVHGRYSARAGRGGNFRGTAK